MEAKEVKVKESGRCKKGRFNFFFRSDPDRRMERYEPLASVTGCNVAGRSSLAGVDDLLIQINAFSKIT